MKPKLIIIFGPQAVGKMTVGHELEKITDLKLFHNHMTIDIVLPFFDYGSPVSIKLVKKLREDVLKAVAKSEIPGIIFTFIWDFNSPKDTNYVKKLIKQAITAAHKKNRKIGICGDAPSTYPEFAEFLVECGIDSISLSPDAVVKTLLVVADKERRMQQ